MTTYCNGKPYRQGIDWFDLTAIHDAVWEGEDMGDMMNDIQNETNQQTKRI